MKMKVFISQPMNGKTEKQIKTARTRAANKIAKYLDEEIEVIDSYFLEAPKDYSEGVYMLGKSIQLMAQADYVVFAKGWEKARGCKIEHQVADAYELNIIDIENI